MSLPPPLPADPHRLRRLRDDLERSLKEQLDQWLLVVEAAATDPALSATLQTALTSVLAGARSLGVAELERSAEAALDRLLQPSTPTPRAPRLAVVHALHPPPSHPPALAGALPLRFHATAASLREAASAVPPRAIVAPADDLPRLLAALPPGVPCLALPGPCRDLQPIRRVQRVGRTPLEWLGAAWTATPPTAPRALLAGLGHDDAARVERALADEGFHPGWRTPADLGLTTVVGDLGPDLVVLPATGEALEQCVRLEAEGRGSVPRVALAATADAERASWCAGADRVLGWPLPRSRLGPQLRMAWETALEGRRLRLRDAELDLPSPAGWLASLQDLAREFEVRSLGLIRVDLDEVARQDGGGAARQVVLALAQALVERVPRTCRLLPDLLAVAGPGAPGHLARTLEQALAELPTAWAARGLSARARGAVAPWEAGDSAALVRADHLLEQASDLEVALP